MTQQREVSFKFWLRGPADNPRVEIVTNGKAPGDLGYFSQGAKRSIMRELLGEDESRDLEAAEGRWLLPGSPP